MVRDSGCGSTSNARMSQCWRFGIPAGTEGGRTRLRADNGARMPGLPINPQTHPTPIVPREFTFAVRRMLQCWIAGEITLEDILPAIRVSDVAPGGTSPVHRQAEHRGNGASGGSPAVAPAGHTGPRSPAASICGRAIAPPELRWPRRESRFAAASWPRRPGPPGDSAHGVRSDKTPGPRPSPDSAPACAARSRANRPPGALRETSWRIAFHSPCPRAPGRSRNTRTAIQQQIAPLGQGRFCPLRKRPPGADRRGPRFAADVSARPPDPGSRFP